jgi:hypothetical protein
MTPEEKAIYDRGHADGRTSGIHAAHGYFLALAEKWNQDKLNPFMVNDLLMKLRAISKAGFTL